LIVGPWRVAGTASDRSSRGERLFAPPSPVGEAELGQTERVDERPVGGACRCSANAFLVDSRFSCYPVNLSVGR
jgi:hypothetical protein